MNRETCFPREHLSLLVVGFSERCRRSSSARYPAQKFTPLIASAVSQTATEPLELNINISSTEQLGYGQRPPQALDFSAASPHGFGANPPKLPVQRLSHDQLPLALSGPSQFAATGRTCAMRLRANRNASPREVDSPAKGIRRYTNCGQGTLGQKTDCHLHKQTILSRHSMRLFLYSISLKALPNEYESV